MLNGFTALTFTKSDDYEKIPVMILGNSCDKTAVVFLWDSFVAFLFADVIDCDVDGKFVKNVLLIGILVCFFTILLLRAPLSRFLEEAL